MQSASITTTSLYVDEEPDTGGSTVRSDISVASSGYCHVGTRIKQRNGIPNYVPEEPPPDYDAKPTCPHSNNVGKAVYEPLLQQERQISVQTGDVQKIQQVPLLQPHEPTRRVSQSESSSSIVLSITGASPTQDIKIHITDQQSPGFVKEHEPFLYRKDGSQKKQPTRKTCRKCSRMEKVLIGLVILFVIALVLVVLNFTVCIGDFTSACPKEDT